MIHRTGILLLATVLFYSCGTKATIAHHGNTVVFDGLIGHWIRTNDKEGQKTYERWEKASVDEYTGLGWTLQSRDTIFKEDLRIARLNGEWNYEVRGVNEQPTYFKITHHSNNVFIAENLQNDFPKRIEYSIEKDILSAKISDEENEIPFLFKRSFGATTTGE